MNKSDVPCLPIARWARRIVPLAGAAAMAACSVQTPLPDLPQATPTHWQDRDGAAGQARRPDLQDWWHAFDDATLNDLIERALQDNLGVQIAEQRLKAARILRHRARSEFWPNLNFRVFEETAPAGTTGYLEIGFDATWELGLFGRSQGSARTNIADENTALIDDAAARVSVIAEVAKNYVELRAAQTRKRLLDGIVDDRERQLELARTRLRTHLGARAEVDHAQAEWVQARSEADEATPVIVQTQQALAVLLGSNVPDPRLAEASAQPQLAAVEVAQTPADLVRTRPEIRRAEQSVLRAAGELGIARADLYPRFGLAGTLLSSTALTGDLDRANKAVPVGAPVITIPLLDWGARREMMRARETALSAAVLAYREAVLEGVAEAQTALAQFDARTRQLDAAHVSLTLAERGESSAKTLQRIGLGDGSDVAGARLALAQSRLQQSQAQREQALGYIALYKAFGGRIPPLISPRDETKAR